MKPVTRRATLPKTAVALASGKIERRDLETVSRTYARSRKPNGPIPVRSDWHYFR